MSRLRAAGVHFGICALIAIGLLCAFWFVWYPSPLLQALGGVEIFFLILGVDVVLGPVLTFIVFRSGKKTLKFDLAVIGVIQAAGLIYGVHALVSARPAYIAALGHRFDVIQANEVDEAGLAKVEIQLPWLWPRWVGVRLADDPKERERLLFIAVGGAKDYGHFPQHHQHIENMRDEILKNAQPISDLKKLNPGEESAIDKWLAKRDVTEDSVRFQGLKARAKDMAVIVDAKTAKVIGIAPFKPWE